MGDEPAGRDEEGPPARVVPPSPIRAPHLPADYGSPSSAAPAVAPALRSAGDEEAAADSPSPAPPPADDPEAVAAEAPYDEAADLRLARQLMEEEEREEELRRQRLLRDEIAAQELQAALLAEERQRAAEDRLLAERCQIADHGAVQADCRACGRVYLQPTGQAGRAGACEQPECQRGAQGFCDVYLPCGHACAGRRCGPPFYRWLLQPPSAVPSAGDALVAAVPGLAVRELRELCHAWDVDPAGCVEKPELTRRLLDRLAAWRTGRLPVGLLHEAARQLGADVAGLLEKGEVVGALRRRALADEHVCAACDPGGACPLCLDPLGALQGVRLACGHALHYACVVAQVRSARWRGQRVRLAQLNCAGGCGRWVEHKWLRPLLEPLLRVRAQVERQALARAERDGLFAAEGGGGGGAEARLALALRTYEYYGCYHCGNPYFGGRAACAEAGGERAAPNAEEVVCPGCGTMGLPECPKHGAEFVGFKCYMCCQQAVFFCFGTTHFCAACHPDGRRPPPHPTPCPGAAACPLGGRHPANPSEHPIGCALCGQPD